MVTGSVSLVPDKLLHWLQLTLETTLHKCWWATGNGDVWYLGVQFSTRSDALENQGDALHKLH